MVLGSRVERKSHIESVFRTTAKIPQSEKRRHTCSDDSGWPDVGVRRR